MNTKRSVFTSGVGTSENTAFSVHKVNQNLKKKKKKVSFLFLFTIIMHSPTRRLSRQKTIFFLALSRHFVLFNVFSGFSIGWKRSLHLKMRQDSISTTKGQYIGGEKKCRNQCRDSVVLGLTSRAASAFRSRHVNVPVGIFTDKHPAIKLFSGKIVVRDFLESPCF